ETQRPDERSVDDAEGGCVEADAEPKRQNDDEGKSRLPAECTEHIAKILPDGLKRWPAPHRLGIFRRQRYVPESDESLAPRLLWRDASVDVVLGFALDVIADVLFEAVWPWFAVNHAFTPVRRDAGCARRPGPACPTCSFPLRVVSAPWA